MTVLLMRKLRTRMKPEVIEHYFSELAKVDLGSHQAAYEVLRTKWTFSELSPADEDLLELLYDDFC